MRVLYLYPWGSFYPATSGAEFVACNQLDYLQSRHFDVHCVLCKVLGQTPGNLARLRERFPCIRSIHVLDVSARALTLRDLLYAFNRAAGSAEFRALANDSFELFLANYVLSAPFACAVPHSVFKVVETLDVLAGMFRTLDLLTLSAPPSQAIQALERRFLFERVELDLYRAFDRALMISREEAQIVRSAGYPGAVYIPQPFPVRHQAARDRTSFRYDLAFVGSENQLNTRGILWFYRHIYIPYLRPRRVRLAVAGRVCLNLDFEDALVHSLGFVSDLDALYNDSKLVVVPLSEGTGISIKLHEALAAGRAVVTTPTGCRGIDPSSDAMLCVDMQRQPKQAAQFVLDLLADDEKREAMQARALDLIAKLHSPDAYARAMDSVVGGRLRTVA
jgi:glycosyltransferase involved in cell wall biosynthesis